MMHGTYNVKSEHCSTQPMGLIRHNGPTARLGNKQSEQRMDGDILLQMT
jgi:hypothetical protein